MRSSLERKLEGKR